jgi:hypothetical protein
MTYKLCLFILTALFLVPIAVAAEAPAFSLGTMQPINSYNAYPGENKTVDFYIFNAYGNRISHIVLSVASNPDNLVIDLPPLETNTWNISGIMTPVEENLYVEPMPIVLEQPANPPAGIYYLKATNITGYIPAKKVTVTVRIPEDAQLGKTYEITINALAKWYGEAGTVQISQARPFSYRILVTTKEYSESLVQPGSGAGGFTLTNEIIFGIVITILVVVILFQQFRPKRRR